MQEGQWDDMKHMGATLRCRSFNAVNLMPVVAERKMSRKGIPLVTYRNQLTFLDMYDDESEASNYNWAVTGTSGQEKVCLSRMYCARCSIQAISATSSTWSAVLAG